MAGTEDSGAGNPFGELTFQAGPIVDAASAPDFGTGDTTSGSNGNDSGDAAGTRTRKPRSDAGKPRGTRGPNRARGNANSKTSIDALSRVLVIVHAGLASASKTPELNLGEDDANSLAMATANVLEQFNIKPDPKIEAIVGLVVVAGTVYAPKLIMVRERLKEERASKARPVTEDSPAVDMTGATYTGQAFTPTPQAAGPFN